MLLSGCSKKLVTTLTTTSKTSCQDGNDHLKIAFFGKIVMFVIKLIRSFLFNNEPYRMKQELITKNDNEFRF